MVPRRALPLLGLALSLHLAVLGAAEPPRVASPLPQDELVRFETARFGRYWGPVFSVSFAPGGKTIASVLGDVADRAISLWDPTTGKERQRLPLPPVTVLNAVFSPDGRTLAAVAGEEDRDWPVCLWDVATSRFRPPFAPPPQGAWSVAFAPDGKTFVTGSAERTIRQWDLATGREVRSYRAVQGPVYTVAFSPELKRLRR